MTALLLVLIALLGICLVVIFIEPLVVVGLLERLTPRLAYRIPTHRPLVALSFDDGPHSVFTPQVLEILKRHNATAIFFLIGDRALRNRELVGQIKAAGHEVANHDFTDGSILGHSEAVFADNLERTDRAIGIASDQKLFRLPGGVARPAQVRLAEARGYQCFLGCAYPHDPMHPRYGTSDGSLKRILPREPSSSFTTGLRTPRGAFEHCRTYLARGTGEGCGLSQSER
jgi:peptidoglycan/xylan/chitin deacetylase (PgdA/CDA1 family)